MVSASWGSNPCPSSVTEHVTVVGVRSRDRDGDVAAHLDVAERVVDQRVENSPERGRRPGYDMRPGVASDGDPAGLRPVRLRRDRVGRHGGEVDRAHRCRIGAQLGREQQLFDDVAELTGAAHDAPGLVDQVGLRIGCGERALKHLGAGVRLREWGPEFVTRVRDEAPLPLAGEFEWPHRAACACSTRPPARRAVRWCWPRAELQ